MENIREKAQDDQDFLYSYGSVRTRPVSESYRFGWELIYGSPDRKSAAVIAPSSEANIKEN